MFIQAVGFFRGGCLDIGGPPAFSAITEEGELGDDQSLAFFIQKNNSKFIFPIIQRYFFYLIE